MQERYCQCGKAVLVRYENAKGVMRARIVSGQHHREAETETGRRECCPNCGRPLDIHALR